MMTSSNFLRLLTGVVLGAVLWVPTQAMAQEEPCDEIGTCLDDCANDDVQCANACIAAGDSEVAPAWQAAFDCVVEAGCAFDDEVCVVENCEEEIIALDAACDGEPSDCIGSDDPDCCEFANDDECDEPDLCAPGTDTTDCSGEPANNDVTDDINPECIGFLSCIFEQCGESTTDIDCILGCVDAFEDPELAAVAEEAFSCAAASGCALDDEDDACIEAACGDEGDAFEAACFGDGVVEPGDDDDDTSNNEANNDDGGDGGDGDGGDGDGGDGGEAGNGGDAEGDGFTDDDPACAAAPGERSNGMIALFLVGLVALRLRRRQ